MISINLLDSRRKEVLERQAVGAKLLMTSIGISFVAALITSGMFAASLYFNNQLADTETEISQIETELDTFTDVYVRLAKIGSQLNSVEQILETRLYAEMKLSLFIELVESGIMQIRSVGFGGALRPMEFEVVGTVIDTKEFVQMHDFMKKLAEEKDFNTLTLAAFNRGADGQYSFRYVVRLNTLD